MTAQHFEFAERLSRIDAGQGTFKNTLFVGAEDSYTVTYKPRGYGQRRGMGRMLGNIGYPLTLLMAFLIGVASNIAVRMFSFLSETPAVAADNIDFLLLTDFGIALMIASILGVLCRIGIRDYIGLRIAGIIAGMIGLHNFVHLYPEQFARVFSQVWVGAVINSTEPQSLLVRGVSIVF